MKVKETLPWLVMLGKPLAAALQAAALAMVAGLSAAAAFAHALHAALPADALKPFVSWCRELLLLAPL